MDQQEGRNWEELMTDQPFIIIIAWSGEKKSIQALLLINIATAVVLNH